ncbi:MAG: hypothetical protein HY898_02925 [Deltaproteobacteria bacterium]|nr:hypothetical protein [Deltaproteobacteria bacterium]
MKSLRWLFTGLAVLAVACAPVRSEPEQTVVVAPTPISPSPATVVSVPGAAEPAPSPAAVPLVDKRQVDVNGDGKPDIVRYYEAGQLVREEMDLDFDGRPDVRSFYEGGRLVRKEYDLDGDGKADRVERFP